jgi:hypothetical protein
MNYIIFSPGRTGSQMIAFALKEKLKEKLKERLKLNVYFSYNGGVELFDPDLNFIYHTHESIIPNINKLNCTAIISRRSDEFLQIISGFVAHHTKEYHPYISDSEPNCFNINPTDFLQVLHSKRQYYDLIDRSNYVKVVDIIYEEMLTDDRYLFKKLDLPGNMEYLTKKSPYGTSLIKNIDELLIVYQGIK